MSLKEALDDLRGEIESGREFETALNEIASDASLHPELLRRKFAERFGTAEEVKERFKASKETVRTIDYGRVRELIEQECRRYRRKPDQFYPLQGKREVTIAS